MRIIGIGDLVADIYYDKNKKLIGVDGGISVQNILCNLSFFGFDTYSFSVCGNDNLGNICIKSLKDCGVNTDNIEINPHIKTKAYYINNILKDNKYVFKSTTICPYCNKDNWYDNSYINVDNVLKNIKKSDLLIFDYLNESNRLIINKTNNIKFLDLGQFKELDDIDNNELIKCLSKFEIINFNERVFNYLLERFNLKTKDLAKKLNIKLIIITRGIKGTSYILNNKEYFFPLNNPEEEIDDSGCGDISFSVIIKNYLKNKKIITEDKLNIWFNETINYTRMIVKMIGSRTFIKPMYSITKEGICNED